MKLELLDWDSNFFGLSVWKHYNIELNVVDKKKFKAGLTYLFSDTSIENCEEELCDIKVTYLKHIVEKNISETTCEFIKPYISKKVNLSIMYELSIQSGLYSRFKIDKNIPTSKFEELYRLWMDNSINKSFADELLVYSDDKFGVLGMVSLSLEGKKTRIGLISVLDVSRGKGVGRALMLACEKWAIKKGCHSIVVDTQQNNLIANNFYNSLDYKVINKNYIYHLWR